MFSLVKTVGLVASALVLTSCDELGGFSDSQRFRDDFHYSYDLKPGGVLYMENMNGSIEISGWDKSTIDISGTKYAAEENALKGMKVDVVAGPDSVRIRTIAPSGYRGNLGARYVIRVPQRTQLDKISSSNGSVRIDGLQGAARVRTSNGSVRVMNVAGPLELQTSNGAVEANDVQGGVTIHTTNGGIRIDGLKGALEAVTTNGGIRARLNNPDAQKAVRLESSNGSVDLTMDNLKDNDIRVSTSNSSITLRLPANARGQLRAHTSHGRVTTDFDVHSRGFNSSKTNVEGTIGTGGPILDLSTSNGSISVLKL
jgi:hypothetical protein